MSKAKKLCVKCRGRGSTEKMGAELLKTTHQNGCSSGPFQGLWLLVEAGATVRVRNPRKEAKLQLQRHKSSPRGAHTASLPLSGHSPHSRGAILKGGSKHWCEEAPGTQAPGAPRPDSLKHFLEGRGSLWHP